MNTLYATLADCRTQDKAENTVDNTQMISALRTVSKRVNMLLTDPQRPHEFFAPTIATLKVIISPDHVNTQYGLLELPLPLLALTSVNASGTALVVGTDVTGYPDSSTPPFTDLQLSADYAYNWYYFCSTTLRRPYAQIGGTWGYHSAYAYAWQQVDTLRAALVDTTSTTIPVNTVDGAGSDGNTPAFSPGNLIQIDSEMMNVTAVNNTAPRTITVAVRGDNGSTAATHLINAPIKVWQVEADIRAAVARQAAFVYARRGAFTTTEVSPMGAELRYPADLLPELRAAIQPYSYI